jgi:hypothetical protein
MSLPRNLEISFRSRSAISPIFVVCMRAFRQRSRGTSLLCAIHFPNFRISIERMTPRNVSLSPRHLAGGWQRNPRHLNAPR